jgi:phosphatidyl-myo-inositol alpha-mannosyltransferase
MASAKLKIGLVVDTDLDATDGVQQYVLTLGRWLQAQGHEVRYLAGETHRQDLPGLYSLARNMRVRFNGNSLTVPLPARRRRIKSVLRDEQFDVLHVQTPHSPFMAQKVVLNADPGTAIFGTFHILPYGWPSRLGNRLLGYWLRPSLKRFDEIVSVSPAAADFAHETFGIKTAVLPNMTDLAPLQAAKALAEYDDDTMTILFLGRLVPRKGCLMLLEAVAQLVKRSDLPKFRVVICGRGPLQARLERFIADNRLQDVVSLVGFVSEADKPRYYASADIAVFPSRGGESFGIVLLEAMASGQALVLAADNPGYRSVMAGREELLFDPNDTAGLADKLAKYLKDDSERQSLQDWSQQHVQQFDTGVVGRKLVARYYQALRKKRAT